MLRFCRIVTAVFCVALPVAVPVAVTAQQDTALPELRRDLAQVAAQIQTLRAELNSPAEGGLTFAGNPLERLNLIESELARLTGAAEQLDYRIRQVTDTASRTIGDLEFRLCELEPECDLSSVGVTPLGPNTAPGVAAPDVLPGPELTVAEQADLNAALALLDQGDATGAANLLLLFTQNYPGSPLTQQAHYMRGEALESLGKTADAARAYLAAFSSDESGEFAATAMFKLGTALIALGQVSEGCITLEQVTQKYPAGLEATDARTAYLEQGCL